jgi:hypothetical protein
VFDPFHSADPRGSTSAWELARLRGFPEISREELIRFLTPWAMSIGGAHDTATASSGWSGRGFPDNRGRWLVCPREV